MTMTVRSSCSRSAGCCRSCPATRILIVKDAVWPLAAGVVSAGSCLRGKPVSFFMLRPMLTQGRPENRPFWDQVWSRGGAVRRCLRVLALGWSVVLLAAGAR